MKKRALSTQLIIGLAVVVLAASRSVAIRVDVQTLPVAGDDTTLMILTEIAPEDQGRIGTQARMRVKLLRGDTAVLHLLLDVDIDSEGRAQAKIEAPPGTYELEVGLVAESGDATGFWRGTIAVPVVNEGETPALLAPPETAAQTATTKPKAPPASTPVESDAEATPTPVSKTAVPETAIAAAVVPATSSETRTSSGAVDQRDPAVLHPPSAVVEPEPPVSTVLAPTIIASRPDPPSTSAQLEITHPETNAASSFTHPPASRPLPNPSQYPTPEDTTGHEPTFMGTPPDTPEEKLPPGSTPPSLLHEAPAAFLIALDVAEKNLGRASAISEQFLRVAERDGFAAIEMLPRPSSATSALSRMAAALDSVAQPPDGATLVLITDGLRAEPRADWKVADTDILQAGVPLLAVGLWGDEFNATSRKNLGRIAAYSGGRFYLLQPGEAARSVVSFFELND